MISIYLLLDLWLYVHRFYDCTSTERRIVFLFFLDFAHMEIVKTGYSIAASTTPDGGLAECQSAS